jgi:hypothetical protein
VRVVTGDRSDLCRRMPRNAVLINACLNSSSGLGISLRYDHRMFNAKLLTFYDFAITPGFNILNINSFDSLSLDSVLMS